MTEIVNSVKSKIQSGVQKEAPLIEQLFGSVVVCNRDVVVLFSVIYLFALSQIVIPLPNSPVPLTMQTFGVISLGAFVGIRLGIISLLIYVLIGALGLPIFQNLNGGIEYFIGVTGGYIIGFVPALLVAAFFAQYGFNRYWSSFAMFISTLLIYIPAVIWLSAFDFGWPANETFLIDSVFQFLPGDIIKALFAGGILTFLWKIADRKKSNKKNESG